MVKEIWHYGETVELVTVWQGIINRFSNKSSYDLTEKFNSLKQHNSSVSDYTKQFEDLMAEIQEQNPEVSEL